MPYEIHTTKMSKGLDLADPALLAFAQRSRSQLDLRRQFRRRLLERGRTMAGTKLEMLGSLQQFMIAMLSKASETPQLEGSRTIFGGKVVQVLELSQEQAGLTADKQD